jgi:hypothetical protein
MNIGARFNTLPSTVSSATDESQVAPGALLCDRFLWVRVTDEAKRRPLGLTCRAALPFEGLEDARPVSRPHLLSVGHSSASR